MELLATSGLELFPVFFVVVLAVDLVGKSSSFSDENSESWWSKLQVNNFQKVPFVYHFNLYRKIYQIFLYNADQYVLSLMKFLFKFFDKIVKLTQFNERASKLLNVQIWNRYCKSLEKNKITFTSR